METWLGYQSQSDFESYVNDFASAIFKAFLRFDNLPDIISA